MLFGFVYFNFEPFDFRLFGLVFFNFEPFEPFSIRLFGFVYFNFEHFYFRPFGFVYFSFGIFNLNNKQKSPKPKSPKVSISGFFVPDLKIKANPTELLYNSIKNLDQKLVAVEIWQRRFRPNLCLLLYPISS